MNASATTDTPFGAFENTDLDVPTLERMLAEAMLVRAATLERRYQLTHDNEQLHRQQVEAQRVGRRMVKVDRRAPIVAPRK